MILEVLKLAYGISISDQFNQPLPNVNDLGWMIILSFFTMALVSERVNQGNIFVFLGSSSQLLNEQTLMKAGKENEKS